MNYSREPNIRLDRRRRHGAIASLFTAAFVAILTLLVMLFVTSAPVEGQDDRSINDSISASRALVADDLYRVTAAAPLPSLTLPLNVAPASSGNSSDPIVSFTTTTPLQTVKETGARYFGVEEGKTGKFWITLDRVTDETVTLNVGITKFVGDKVKYTDPSTNKEKYLTNTEERTIKIPPGQLRSVPFIFDHGVVDDSKYTVLVRQFVTVAYFTIVDPLTARVLDDDDANRRLSLRWVENDIPELSLKFDDDADNDEVLEAGDRFEVVVGTKPEISNDGLRIDATLKAYADGVALDWPLPSVTIPAGETETLPVPIEVPGDRMADIEGKYVVLRLESAVVQEIGYKMRTDARLKPTDTLTLNTANPKVSLNTDSLTLVEGESTTITVEVSGDISNVANETLTFVVSDEKFKDDYRVKPSYITLADVKAGKTFEIGAVDDGANLDPGETFTLRLSSSLSSEDIQIDYPDELTLEIIDNMAPYALLEVDSLTLTEGESATITVRVGGDIDSVADETLKLVIFDEALKDDYRIIPEEIILAQARDVVTFEIEAVDDRDYDPGESFVLELVPSSSTIQVIRDNRLVVDINDDDPFPIISFSVPHPWGPIPATDHHGHTLIEIISGDTARFEIALDRKSNYDVPFYVSVLPIFSPKAWIAFEEWSTGEGRDVPLYRKWRGMIPAGELSTPFTLITDPEIGSFEYLIGIVQLDIDSFEEHRATLGGSGSAALNLVHNYSLSASFNTDSLTLVEGESAIVTISAWGDAEGASDLTLRSLKSDFRDDYEIRPAKITFAEAKAGASFEILAVDDKNIEPDEIFALRLIALSGGVRTTPQNELTLEIIDNSHPYALLEIDSLVLGEGERATIGVEVNGDISLVTDETFTLVSSNGAFNDAFRVTPADITVADAKDGVTFEVESIRNEVYDPDRRVVLELRSSSDEIDLVTSTLVLNIVDNGIYASLSTNTLTLLEGETTTVRVKVDGDVSAVTDEKLMLVVSDEAFIDDYRVRPAEVTLTDAQDGVSFVIEAVDNDIYDSDRKFALELTSTLDTNRFVNLPQLAVTVLNDDKLPRIAFVGEGVYTGAGGAYLDVDEGDVREFVIELDRESSEKVSISVFLNDNTDAVTAEQLRLKSKRIPFIAPTRQPQNRGDEGWSPGIDILEPYWLTIPAGSREVRFTVNFEEFADEHLSSLLKQDVVSLYFGIEDGSGAVADPTRSRLTIRRVEDDTPEVSLQFNPADPSITVTEDSSFEVWVELTGNGVNDNFDLEVTLTATVTAGAALDLKLSTVTSSNGATVTVVVADDDLANGNRKIELELERVVLKDNTIPWFATEFELEAAAGLTLTVDVIDDEIPTVSLSTNTLTLYEGETRTVMVELRGDLDSLIGTTLKFEPRPGGTAGVDDYVTPTITIGEEARGETQKIYAADIYASYGSGREASETVVLQLNPSAERINVLSDELRLNIFDDSPRASLSTNMLTLEEGETMTVEIILRGDLSSVVGETLELVRLDDDGIDYPATAAEDYTLTLKLEGYDLGESRITIDEAVAEAGYWTYTIEVLAKVDGVYDPDESVRLGLVSSSDRVEFVGIGELALDIVNGEGLPTLSFADDFGKLDIIESEKFTITVELDYASNRQITVSLDFSPSGAKRALRYGYDLGRFIPPAYPANVLLEAGETTAQIILDTSVLDNEIYIRKDSARDAYITVGILSFNQEYKSADDLEVILSEDFEGYIVRIKDNEQEEPTLILRAGEFDPRKRIEVSEGESFTVWVGLSHPYDDATLSSVELVSSDSDLIVDSRVDIPGEASARLYTFRVKDDNKYKPATETVELSFADENEDGEQSASFDIDGAEHYIDLKIGNKLTVVIMDDDRPTARLVPGDNTIIEGETGTIKFDLSGGDRTVIHETYTLELVPVPGVDLEGIIDASTLKVMVSPSATLAVFNVFALDDDLYDIDAPLKFKLVSSNEIVDTGDETIYIHQDEDDKPTISFVNAKTTEPFSKGFVPAFEGGSATIGVKLSNPSALTVTVYLELVNSDEPGSIDASKYLAGTFIPEKVTIAPGETYTTIIYDTRALDDADYYDITVPSSARVNGRESRHLGDLKFRTGSDEFVTIADEAKNGLPLVVTGVPTISFVYADTMEPFKPARQSSFSGGTEYLLRGEYDERRGIYTGYLAVEEGETTTIGIKLSRPSRHTITVNLELKDDTSKIRSEYEARDQQLTLGSVRSSEYDTYMLIPMLVTIAPGEIYTTISYGTGVLENSENDLPDLVGAPGTLEHNENYRYLADLEFVIPEGDRYVRVPHNRLMGGYIPLVVIEDDPR